MHDGHITWQKTDDEIMVDAINVVKREFLIILNTLEDIPKYEKLSRKYELYSTKATSYNRKLYFLNKSEYFKKCIARINEQISNANKMLSNDDLIKNYFRTKQIYRFLKTIEESRCCPVCGMKLRKRRITK